MSRNACECRTRRRSARSRRHRAQLRRVPRRVRATPLISMTARRPCLFQSRECVRGGGLKPAARTL